VELVFRALADPSRRSLLDRLFERDGQTLSGLCAHAEMTRFGVMKHLRVLEAAGLVTTRRVGREKFHYLNPVPIRLLHDRWISKYAAPWVGTLGDLKRRLEEEDVMNAPRHVYEVYIRTTPGQLWEAITRPELTRQYFYATAVESDWKVGSPVRHLGADGSVKLEGRILAVDPPRRLVTTFSAVHGPGTEKDRPSRVTWEIEPRGEVCRLTLVHDDFDGATETFKMVGSGWNPVLSGLKSLLETGRPLVIGPAPSAATR
jgi:uncharacterized protein YndB with AHSA1/START domain